MTYSCAIFPSLDSDIDRTTPDLSDSSPLSRDGFTSNASTPTVIDGEDGQKPSSTDDGNDDLHEAQMRKLRHIIRKADIRPGHRVLEIGSGWGSLSLLIAQTIPGTVVDTITLSTQQAELVRARVERVSRSHRDSAGLGIIYDDAKANPDDAEDNIAERVRVHLMDYRSLPAEWAGAFDRVVSVEMVEAVGREFIEVFASLLWRTFH